MHNLQKQKTLLKQDNILCYKSRTYVIDLKQLTQKLKNNYY